MNVLSENMIELKFDKTLSNLAGNRFGRKTFQDQIKKCLKMDCVNIVVIPNVIEDVASSFIQGIYSEMSEKYGRDQATKLMILKSDNNDVMKKIEYSVRVYSL